MLLCCQAFSLQMPVVAETGLVQPTRQVKQLLIEHPNKGWKERRYTVGSWEWQEFSKGSGCVALCLLS